MAAQGSQGKMNFGEEDKKELDVRPFKVQNEFRYDESENV